MALLSKDDLISALIRLGQLAIEGGEPVELLIAGRRRGGSCIRQPKQHEGSRRDRLKIQSSRLKFAGTRGRSPQEKDWPADWLNDGAKGFLTGTVQLYPLFESPAFAFTDRRTDNFWQ